MPPPPLFLQSAVKPTSFFTSPNYIMYGYSNSLRFSYRYAPFQYTSAMRAASDFQSSASSCTMHRASIQRYLTLSAWQTRTACWKVRGRDESATPA